MSAVYASISDLANYGFVPTAQGQVTNPQVNAILAAVSNYADTKLRGRYALPLQLPYPQALVRAVCHIASADIMELRGFDPQNPGDQAIEQRKAYAIKFLDDVQRQAAHLDVIEAVGPAPAIVNPTVLSTSTTTVASFGNSGPGVGPIQFPAFSGAPPTGQNRGF